MKKTDETVKGSKCLEVCLYFLNIVRNWNVYNNLIKSKLLPITDLPNISARVD